MLILMTNTLSAEDKERVRAALLSPDLTIGVGVGDATIPGKQEACTIAEINLVLTGKLTDGPHPCISEVIRRWVIRVQDVMPATMRNSPAWREAAISIAGSAGSDAQEKARTVLIMEWMWDALADEAVIATLPRSALPAWREMLSQKTHTAAYAASVVAHAAAVAVAVDASVVADVAAAADVAADAVAVVAVTYAYVAHAASVASVDAAYWERRDPASLLVKLIGVTE